LGDGALHADNEEIDMIFLLQFIFLKPLSFLFGLLTGVRNFLFDNGILSSRIFDVPVISLGNITVGGTGKTPHVEYIITQFKEQYKIAVLSRGYKRITKGFILAGSDTGADIIGDEPRQIFDRFPDIIVAVDENRVRGIEKLLQAHADIDIVLLDDAFQHRYVKPGLSLLLVDYNRPVFKDSLLPYGRMRESWKGKCRADAVIVSKTPADLKAIELRIFANNLELFSSQKLFFTTVNYGDLRGVFHGKKIQEDISISSVIALCGIAQPAAFISKLREISKEVHEVIFPDHHLYTPIDLRKILDIYNSVSSKNKIIVTTEKDAVRLRHFSELDDSICSVFYYLPIEVAFLQESNSMFNQMIESYVGANKSYHKFHKESNHFSS